MLRAESSPVLRAQDLDWNLLNPAFQRDPYQHYRWERDHGAVHVLSAGDHTYYRIIGYDEIVTVLTDTQTFSSRTTNELGWLVFRDPPEHDKLRQAIAKAFTPRAIAVLDAPVAEIVTDLWNHVLADHGGDLHEFCNLLPVSVISLILGIPVSRRQDMSRWSLQSLEVLGSMFGFPVSSEAKQGSAEFVDYLKVLLDSYRHRPADNIGAHLVTLSMQGEISGKDLLAFAQFLFVAGHETTMHSLLGGFGILAQDQALFYRIKEQPELIKVFVEEVLRYRTTIQAIARISTRDTEIGGVKIPKGAVVIPVLANGNLDSKKFEGPETFVLGRPNANQHLTFGKGIHTCIGAPLARREMQLTFEHAIKTIKSITLDPLRPPIPHIGGSTNEYGFDSLSVKIEPMPTLDLIFPRAT